MFQTKKTMVCLTSILAAIKNYEIKKFFRIKYLLDKPLFFFGFEHFCRFLVMSKIYCPINSSNE